MEYIFLLLALLAIVWGANTLINGAVQMAQRFEISDFVIGAVIVGVGTSFPELVVSAYGALQGKVDVAIGNVVGSNIFNVLGILGLTALISPITINRKNLRFEIPFCIGISILAILLAFNFFAATPLAISRADGALLLGIFLFYLYFSFGNEKSSSNKTTKCNTPLWRSMLQVLIGLSILVMGCHFFVDTAAQLAKEYGVDEAFISITLIACGTSLPELAASLAAAWKRNTQLALGNIVGSNIFNITFILGTSAVITPLSGGGVTLTDYLVMLLAAILPLLFGYMHRISRWGGLLMFGGLVAYLAHLLQQQGY